MEKEFLNRADLSECILNICKDTVDYSKWEDIVDDYVVTMTESIINDMRKYVHEDDTSMIGNFANIREDWDIIKDFAESEIEPFGRFDDIIKSIDNNTINDTDLIKFQKWALDWFFTAFGTFGIKYNLQTLIGDIEYSEED